MAKKRVSKRKPKTMRVVTAHYEGLQQDAQILQEQCASKTARIIDLELQNGTLKAEKQSLCYELETRDTQYRNANRLADRLSNYHMNTLLRDWIPLFNKYGIAIVLDNTKVTFGRHSIEVSLPLEYMLMVGMQKVLEMFQPHLDEQINMNLIFPQRRPEMEDS